MLAPLFISSGAIFFIKSDQEKAKVFDMVERFAIKGGRDFF